MSRFAPALTANPGRATALALALLLLAQALLPLQAHTRWDTDSNGDVVMLCTWQGAKYVNRDGEPVAADPSGPNQPADQAAESPAVVFSQLLAGIVGSVPVATVALVGEVSTPNQPVTVSRTRGAPVGLQQARAPPILGLKPFFT